uniref:hypothetical protein n=2 Tax=Pseudomonadati TaxID=3379134 RepID=UPI00404AC9CB
PKYITWIEQHYLKYIFVKEAEDEQCKQTHLHLHGIHRFTNQQALRDSLVGRKIKGKFKEGWFPELHGSNGRYSLKESGGNEIGYQYVCKGLVPHNPDYSIGKPNVLATNFTEEEIKDFHYKYWNHEKRIIVDAHQAIEEKHLTIKKPRAKTFMEKLSDELQESYPDKLWDSANDTDYSFLKRYLYKKLGKAVKKINKRIYADLFNGLYMSLPKSYENEEEDIKFLSTVIDAERFG